LGATAEGVKRWEEGRWARGPPSRERETWILVSEVVRIIRAVRGAGGVSAILGEGGVSPIFGVGGERMGRMGMGEEVEGRFLVVVVGVVICYDIEQVVIVCR